MIAALGRVFQAELALLHKPILCRDKFRVYFRVTCGPVRCSENQRLRTIDDDDRNHDEMRGERVLRGGSWYTASIAVLYIPYRDNFRPGVETPYLGFRIVARPIP